jgi:NAD(P)H-dependent FMN reductase
MSSLTPFKVGVIICSQRIPRAGPQITDFVVSCLNNTKLSAGTIPSNNLTIIDLTERALPLFDESGIPSQIHDPAEYDHEHTRAWSKEVSSYDGFVFVTPQYNWGYPASVKNAIDYLFNEWKGKAAMIVSYGGHGGNKASAQLRQVLEAVEMRPTVKMPALSFPDRKLLFKAAKGMDLGLMNADSEVWASDRAGIEEAYLELCDLLAAAVGPIAAKG